MNVIRIYKECRPLTPQCHTHADISVIPIQTALRMNLKWQHSHKKYYIMWDADRVLCCDEGLPEHDTCSTIEAEKPAGHLGRVLCERLAVTAADVAPEAPQKDLQAPKLKARTSAALHEP